jgi:transposase
VTSYSIYNWLKKYGPKAAEHVANTEEAQKIKSLEKELKRVTEERDILKKAAEDSSHQSKRYTSQANPTEVYLYQG